MAFQLEAFCGPLIVNVPLFFHDKHKGNVDAKGGLPQICFATGSIVRQLTRFAGLTRIRVSEMSEVSVPIRGRLPTVLFGVELALGQVQLWADGKGRRAPAFAELVVRAALGTLRTGYGRKLCLRGGFCD
jgi:hypothetical protein